MTAEECVRLGVFATVFGEDPIRFETSFEDADCEQPWFLASAPIGLNALVKLESDGMLWMGVVTACQQEGDRWRITFRVEHILRNVQRLLDLAARFE